MWAVSSCRHGQHMPGRHWPASERAFAGLSAARVVWGQVVQANMALIDRYAPRDH